MPISAAATHAVRERDVVRALVSATPFATSLALHALLGPRDDLEPPDRDAVEAGHANAVHPCGNAKQCAVDVVDGLARRGRQREVALALDAYGVALARLLVELRIALFSLRRELLGRRLELLGLARMTGARLVEQLAQLVECARRERRRQVLRRRFFLDRARPRGRLRCGGGGGFSGRLSRAP